MRRISRAIRTFGVSALFALALAACGGAATTASNTAAPAAATQAPAAQEATAAPADTTQAPANQDATTAPTTAADATAAPAAATTATKLNLNTVTEDQLLSTIPNFPSRMVREFMEYRPYISIQQFRKEIGKYVDQQQVAAYEQYVYVPISVNEADAATLQQIPGVDATVADQLIATRPFASNDAFLAKLTSLAPSANSQLAAAYLATGS